MHVGILGAGSWGTALAIHLAKKGTTVTLWDRNPEHADTLQKERENARYLGGYAFPECINVVTDIAEAVSDCEQIIFAVPVVGVADVAHDCKPHLKNQPIIISAAKGLTDEGKRPSEAISEVLGQSVSAIVALSGPNLALELAREAPSATVAASRSLVAAKATQQMLMNDTFRVYTNPDVIGVELSGAIKNVFAIAAGISDGLGFGDNTKAVLITRGLAEMTRMGIALGAQERTFIGLAGVGDLVATASSRLSRNYRVGHFLADGMNLYQALQELRQVAEGVPTSYAVCDLAARLDIEMPLCQVVRNVVDGSMNIHQAVYELMTRPPKQE